MSSALTAKLHELTPFFFGTAIKWPDITQPGSYSELALQQFSSFTPEHVLKADHLQPLPTIFSWDEADAFVEFSLRNNKRVHGHTLVWDRALPSWIQEMQHTDPRILQRHIQTVVERYKGRIVGWDVVNEAFDEAGKVREGIWFRVAGQDYLKDAFELAHEADPDALLFYNDFDLEANQVKRHGVLHYLNELRALGVPIHGIGLQCHLNISSANISSLEFALREITEAGYLVHISELDLSVNPYSGVFSGKEELFQAQARLVYLVVEKFLLVPPEQRYGITFWGVGDSDSCITSDLKHIDYPLLFDHDYQPKAAWYTLAAMFAKNGHSQDNPG